MALERVHYIEVEITPAMMEAARAKLARKRQFTREQPDINRFGADADRALYGFVGEQMVRAYLGCIEKDEYGYDFLYDEWRVEVKTVAAKFCPPISYDCTVNNIESTAADFYVFTRVLFDCSRGWILGAAGCKDFAARARTVRKGESPGGNAPAFRNRDAKLLPIAELYPIASLVRMAEARRLKPAPSSGGGASGDVWANPEAERARRMTVPEWVAEYERYERPI